jgi:hypothetical protein
LASFTFISRVGFSTTTLALVLDSLVRVSRRVGKNHFGKIALSPSSRRGPSQHAPKQAPSRTASGPRRLHLASLATKPCPLTGFRVIAPRIPFYRVRLNDFKSFNPLSKVLFIFPSQYLFAIGLLRLFSLRRSLSPALCTRINVHDSSTASPSLTQTLQTGLSPSLASASAELLRLCSTLANCLQITIRRAFTRRLPLWAFPASVARTEGILVSFFSSA